MKRNNRNSAALCQAPFNSVFFSMTGKTYFCLANKKMLLGTYPHQSVDEIISGQKAQQFRGQFRDNTLGEGCDQCKRHLEQNTDAAAFINFHSAYAPRKDFMPRYIDFELDNRCNLNCAMCSPYFSSTVPRSDGSKGDFHTPYDEAFYHSFDPYIPHLLKVHFRGGEPFLISRYSDFWEHMLTLNPALRIGVTTNGTVLSAEHKTMLERGAFDINISLDTLQEDTYHKIRVGGNFQQYKEHLDYLVTQHTRGLVNLSACMCLMTYNWKEFPSLFQFCNQHNINIYVNYVEVPEHLSLKSKTSDELRQIVAQFNSSAPDWQAKAATANHRVFSTLLQQLGKWAALAPAVLKTADELLAAVPNDKKIFVQRLSGYLVNNPDFAEYSEVWFDTQLATLRPKEKPGFPIELVYSELLRSPIEMILDKLPVLSRESIIRKILDKYIFMVHLLEARGKCKGPDNNG